jgi:hypothetical protein
MKDNVAIERKKLERVRDFVNMFSMANDHEWHAIMAMLNESMFSMANYH